MLAPRMALALGWICCFQLGASLGLSPGQGQREKPISFPISLECAECLWHEWMSLEQMDSDQPNTCRHWEALGELTELGFALLLASLMSWWRENEDVEEGRWA